MIHFVDFGLEELVVSFGWFVHEVVEVYLLQFFEVCRGVVDYLVVIPRKHENVPRLHLVYISLDVSILV